MGINAYSAPALHSEAKGKYFILEKAYLEILTVFWVIYLIY